MKPQRIGVIGSGQIGPDIALFFAKVFAPKGVPIVVVDVSADALERGKAKLHKKVDKGVQTQAFTAEAGTAMKAAVTFTQDYQTLAGADLVVEAATEDLNLKRRIFAQLETLCSPQAVLASNSSHLPPEEIFAELKDSGRALVIHYFFPAERNPAVEIVPGKATRADVTKNVFRLYEGMGKVPIVVGSRYGYAIDPVFEGMFLAAALLVEQGKGTIKEVDAVAQSVLGYAVGPFTAMNLCGGNPIANHGLVREGKDIMSWYRSPKILQEQVAKNTPWEVAGRGETVDVSADKAATLGDALLGAYFGIVSEILDSGISNVADLELAIPIALDVTGPFTLMNKKGVAKALALVESYAEAHPGFKVAECLQKQAALGAPWDIPVVIRRDEDGVAILTLRRPKVLNALSDATFEQLGRHLRDIENDSQIKGAVITGFGPKAFAAGADIGGLATISSAAQGKEIAQVSARRLREIETSRKPVVCALNGLAFGGGCELALACHVRLAQKGGVKLGLPEVTLGIIPGAGGTQRLPRWIGFDRAWPLLRTGKPFSAKDAVTWGLVQRECDDVLAEAVATVQRIASGADPLPRCPEGPVAVPTELPTVDIGPLSKTTDQILCRAIIDGCAQPLPQGIEVESQAFGDVCATKDAAIGLRAFLAKEKPQFVHA